MVFKPYVIQDLALPRLKVGHIIKIGDQAYVVIGSRMIRTFTNLLATQTFPLDLLPPNFIELTGNYEIGRIVHLQYVAVQSGAGTPATQRAFLKWGTTEPLFSKAAQLLIDNNVAPEDAPMAIDRWSYWTSMFIEINSFTGTGPWNLEFQGQEYEVSIFPGKPSEFVSILPNGFANFVRGAPAAEVQAAAQAIQATKTMGARSFLALQKVKCQYKDWVGPRYQYEGHYRSKHMR